LYSISLQSDNSQSKVKKSVKSLMRFKYPFKSKQTFYYVFAETTHMVSGQRLGRLISLNQEVCLKVYDE